jgi:hypothetical protein
MSSKSATPLYTVLRCPRGQQHQVALKNRRSKPRLPEAVCDNVPVDIAPVSSGIDTEQVTPASELWKSVQQSCDGIDTSTIGHKLRSIHACPRDATKRMPAVSRPMVRSLTSGSVFGCFGRPYRYDGVLDRTSPVSFQSNLFTTITTKLTNTPVPQPLIKRAKIIQMWFWAEHCSAAPRIAQAAPKAIVRTRPILSPTQPPMRHPTRVPR